MAGRPPTFEQETQGLWQMLFWGFPTCLSKLVSRKQFSSIPLNKKIPVSTSEPTDLYHRDLSAVLKAVKDLKCF